MEENRGFGIETLGATARIISNQSYAKFCSRSHDAVIRVYDEAGNVIENARARGRLQGGLTITFEISSEESFRIPTRYLCSTPTTFCTSASKRGSPRRGSSFGSSLIMVMVRLS